jgi:hypothetical protein
VSQLSVNTITNAAGGNTAQINGMTPTADSLQGFRNRVINGSMVIDQRNAGASVTPADQAYTLDRWVYIADQASKCTIEQTISGVSAPAGFTDYLGVTSTASTTITTSQVFAVIQRIEGYNMADLAWGTASAATVTLSFWVRSSLTGTFGGAIRNDAGNYNYPFSYTISAANTWEQKSVTITGATSGTWLTTNGRGMQLVFSLGAGATASGTAGAWSTSSFWSATGATQVLATNGATFYITGVQLEAGSVATPFERRPYSTELQLAQRYFTRLTGRTNSYQPLGLGNTYTTTQGSYCVNVPVTMRTIPSLTTSGAIYFQNLGNVNISSFAGPYSQAAGIVEGDFTMASAVANNTTSFMRFNNATAATQQFDFSAEL